MPSLFYRRAFVFWAAVGTLAVLLAFAVAGALQAALAQGTVPPAAPTAMQVFVQLFRVEAREIGTLMLITFEYVTSLRAWRARRRRGAVPTTPMAWAREAARQAAWRFWLLFGLLAVVVYANQHNLGALLQVASFTAGGALVSSALVNLALDNPIMSRVARGVLRVLKDRGLSFFEEAQAASAAEPAPVALVVPSGAAPVPPAPGMPPEVPVGLPVAVLPMPGTNAPHAGDVLVTERVGDVRPAADEATGGGNPDGESPLLP